MLSCQDLSFAGGQRYDYSTSTSADGSVDVSTATLVSLWDAGPLDNAARQHEPPRRGKSCNMPGPAAREASRLDKLEFFHLGFFSSCFVRVEMDCGVSGYIQSVSSFGLFLLFLSSLFISLMLFFFFLFSLCHIARPLLIRIMTCVSNSLFVLDLLPVSEHGLGHRPTWPDQLSPQLQRNKQVFK